MKDTFIVYTSYLERFAKLTNDQLGALFRAMLEYQSTGVEPTIDDVTAGVCFGVVKFDMDANNEKYEKMCEKQRQNVLKRWEKDDTIVYHGIPPYTTEYQNVPPCTKHTDNDSDNESDNDSDSVSVKKDVRHKYGQYNNVLLSDVDMEKLKTEFPTDWEDRIERLSEYIESKGAKYKNHLATIRAWARKNKPKKETYDWGDLDERSIGCM